jgi:hypothetical protein
MKTILLALVLSLSSAFAAKFTKIQKMTDYSFTQKMMNQFCKDANLDCGLTVYSITEKNSSEKWENTVKQILHSNYYVEEVYADLVKKSSSNTVVNQLAEAAGIDLTNDSVDLLQERLSNDLDDRSVKLVSGGTSGPFGSHSIMAFIDTKNMEIIILSAGYSE